MCSFLSPLYYILIHPHKLIALLYFTRPTDSIATAVAATKKHDYSDVDDVLLVSVFVSKGNVLQMLMYA